MRIDVFVDGKSRSRNEFVVPPKLGDLVTVDEGLLVVDEVRHDLTKNRLQAWCSKRTPIEPIVKQSDAEPSKSTADHKEPPADDAAASEKQAESIPGTSYRTRRR